MSDKALLSDLLLFQDLARSSDTSNEKERQLLEQRRSNVTGRWLGYDENGNGIVEYLGVAYKATILSNTCKAKFSPVNLRRTPLGNFVDWQ